MTAREVYVFSGGITISFWRDEQSLVVTRRKAGPLAD